jgi:hypothetical protein
METSLHRQLKEIYAKDGVDAQIEERLGNYRIDVVRNGELIEIQHGSLAAIRGKIASLLKNHRVRVVKPIVARKRLIKQTKRGGTVVSRRLSPKKGSILDLFHELIYFTRIFPHENLTLEAPLVELEEWRFPGHGRRRWRRKGDQQVEDQKLVRIERTYHFRTAEDLLQLMPSDLSETFDTGELAEGLGIDRSDAQRIAYCLRHIGAFHEVGKRGNARLYRACV